MIKFGTNVPKTWLLMKIFKKLEGVKFCNTKIHHEFALILHKIAWCRDPDNNKLGRFMRCEQNII